MRIRAPAWLVALALAVVGASVMYVAETRAAPITINSEVGPGQNKALAPLGTVVQWSNATSTVYTCSAANGCNGFVVLHIVARAQSGTQPLSYNIQVTGGSAGSISTSVLGLITIPAAFTAVGPAGGTITISPLTTTTGSMTLDLIGYEIPVGS